MGATGFNKEDLFQLEQAIAKGVRTVSYTDRSVTYHSMDEMIRLREYIARKLGIERPQLRFVAQYEKGLT